MKRCTYSMEDKKPEYKVTFSSFKPGICIYGIDYKANELYYQKAVICPQIITGYVIPTDLALKEINLNDKVTVNKIKLDSAIDYLLLMGDLETRKMDGDKNLDGKLCEAMKGKGFYVVKVNNPREIEEAIKAHKALLYKSYVGHLRKISEKQLYSFIDEYPSLDIHFEQL